MKTVAKIAFGESTFDDRLRRVLQESGVEPYEFEELEYFGLLPFFVLAGASLRTKAHGHGDHAHFDEVAVELPQELEESFYGSLEGILEQVFPYEEG